MPSSELRRVLVTGATGFVGSHLCRSLALHGWQVVAAARNAAATASPSITFRRLELFSRPDEWRAAMRGCGAVVHLAARVHQFGRNAATDTDFLRVNVAGSGFVAEQASMAAVPRIVFLSSVKVHGEGGTKPYDPTDPPDPRDAYGRSKWAAEQRLRELCAAGAMELVVVRPPLVYGPGVKANFLRLLRLAGSGMPLPLRSISNRRSMLGIANLVDFIETCLIHPRSPTLPWLVSDGEDLSTPDLLVRLRRLMGRGDRMFGVPPHWLRRIAVPVGLGGTIQRLAGTLQVDSTAARRHLAWSAPSTVDQELARTVAAYLKSDPQ